MLRTPGVIAAALSAVVLSASSVPPALAQDPKADASLLLSLRRLDQFDVTEAGLGAQLSYRFHRWLAADGQASFFPSDAGSPAFSGSRFEGLAGLRIGPRLGRTGVYVALRGGVVRFAEAPEPFPCILIYPPPLVCAIAAGDTVPSFQFGAGFEAFPGDTLVLRFELGDQLLRYEGPAFTLDRDVFQDHLWSHNFKAAVSVGLRF
jgi:hypothetical protein